ncbi:MAG: glutamine synthetase beta-grasp domain-containing protein, partial [Proteobacteria bacterium]|nr:glutamine synthetase beta-grasp domain-containing protein [Pseudomonadota bacterium]
MSANVLKMIKEHDVKFVDLRFCDTRGKEQHVTVPASVVDAEMLDNGKMFDGSSIAGWKGINESDMILMPEAESAVIDPFFDDTTLNIRCDVLEPATMEGYIRDPRSLSKRAEAYLKSTGVADTAYFGPEPEFFIFDDVRWGDELHSAFYEVDSEEGSWNSDRISEDNNIGHRPGVKGGYFPVPPVDSMQNVRSAMCSVLEEMGIKVEVHHHEVATAGQAEIGTAFNTLTRKADELLILKYVVQNVAHAYGKTATFMPKPLVGDNGNGMHVHQSLAKDGENLFAGDKYGGLSDTALHYIA